MSNFEIGVILPGVGAGIDLREAARHAEDAGLDGVWHGDHLGAPTLDVTVALATAAAATSRVRVGTSVFIPGAGGRFGRRAGAVGGGRGAVWRARGSYGYRAGGVSPAAGGGAGRGRGLPGGGRGGRGEAARVGGEGGC